MEFKEPVLVRFISDSSQEFGKAKIMFSGCAGDWEGQSGHGKGRGLYFFCGKKGKPSTGNRFVVHTE
jgi:hypothetical protein